MFSSELVELFWFNEVGSTEVDWALAIYLPDAGSLWGMPYSLYAGPALSLSFLSLFYYFYLIKSLIIL